MKKINEMAIVGMNTIGSGAIDGASPGDTPPARTWLGKRKKMSDAAKRAKKKVCEHKRHVEESAIGNIQAFTSGALGTGVSGTRVPSSSWKRKDDSNSKNVAKIVSKAAKTKRDASGERSVDWRGGGTHGNAYKQRLNAKPSSRDGSPDAEKMAYVQARLDPGSRVGKDRGRNREAMQRTRRDQTLVVGGDLDNNQSRIVRHTPNFGPSNAKNSDVDGEENNGVIVTKGSDGKLSRSYLRTKPGVK